MLRVTVTLHPEDVDLLDRLGALEGSNRSAQLRSVLEQLRPVLTATVAAFEAAQNQRQAFDNAAALVEVSKLQQLIPEAQRLNDAFLGAISRVEGMMAADSADPRPSNTGVTPHTPLYPIPPENEAETGIDGSGPLFPTEDN